jgi:hypothetical protein
MQTSAEDISNEQIREILASRGWHIDDVKNVRPDLTDEQAMQVLKRYIDEHDVEIGINRLVLEIVADDLFPRSEGWQ